MFEREDINYILSPIYNYTNIIQNGNAEYSRRMGYNQHLYVRAWVYVGCVFIIFIVFLVIARIRKHTIHWKTLIFENIGFVTMLALYEYMFFSTIIFPFSPISGKEISRNALINIQSSCGILYN